MPNHIKHKGEPEHEQAGFAAKSSPGDTPCICATFSAAVRLKMNRPGSRHPRAGISTSSNNTEGGSARSEPPGSGGPDAIVPHGLQRSVVLPHGEIHVKVGRSEEAPVPGVDGGTDDPVERAGAQGDVAEPGLRAAPPRIPRSIDARANGERKSARTIAPQRSPARKRILSCFQWKIIQQSNHRYGVPRC